MSTAFVYSQEYNTLHHRIRRMFGKATECEADISHKANKFHWSNKSGLYLENREDWQMLCPACHGEYDKKPDCKLEHPYSSDFYTYPNGKTECNTCRRIRHKEYNRTYYLRRKVTS